MYELNKVLAQQDGLPAALVLFTETFDQNRAARQQVMSSVSVAMVTTENLLHDTSRSTELVQSSSCRLLIMF